MWDPVFITISHEEKEVPLPGCLLSCTVPTRMSVCIVLMCLSICSSSLCVYGGERCTQKKRELILTLQAFLSPWGLQSERDINLTHLKNADVFAHTNTLVVDL